MTIDAIGDSVTLDEQYSIKEEFSTWNGRKVQCQPLNEEALLIRALAFLHLGTQKVGPQELLKLEQHICTLGALEDDDDQDSDLEEDDPLYDAAIAVLQNYACWTTPELMKSEERVKLLLSGTACPRELSQANHETVEEPVIV